MPGCSVYNCANRSEMGIRLFSLPHGQKNEERRNIWIKYINRKHIPVTGFICEEHFEDDQFENNRKDGRRPLKHNAVPTKILEQEPIDETKPILKRSKRKRVIKKYEESDTNDDDDDNDDVESTKTMNKKLSKKSVKCRSCLSIVDKSSGHILRKKILGKSLKEAIILFVPQLASSLSEAEYICDKCYRLLRNFLKFYESCLDVDKKLHAGQISLNVFVEEESPSDDEDWEENKALENSSRKRSSRKIAKLGEEVQKDSDSLEDNLNVNKNGLIDEKENKNLKESTYAGEENNSNESVFSDHEYVNDFYHCPECKIDYKTAKGIRNHLLKYHKLLQEKEFECNQCNMKFIRFKDLVKHKETHGFACDLCDEIFSTLDELSTHKITHKDLFCCKRCGGIFEGEEKLASHSALYDVLSKAVEAIKKSTPIFKCDICDSTFSTKIKVSDHIKSVHLNIKDVNCPLCDKLFTTKTQMQIHKRQTHSDIKSYKCDLCDAVFKRNENLMNHKQTQHAKDPNRRTYGRAKDKNENWFDCPFCLKQYNSKQILADHLLLHANERQYECKYCGLKLTSDRTKFVHERTHESDPNNQFLCPICWKKFPTEEELQNHEVIHTSNNKSFDCCFCGDLFSRKILLENHLLDVHINAPAKVDESETKTIKIIKVQIHDDKGEDEGDLDVSSTTKLDVTNESTKDDIKTTTIIILNEKQDKI